MPRGEAVLHVAAHNGCCYVLDRLMALSSNSDFIVELSRELSCRVIAAGAETVSGTTESSSPFDHPDGLGILAPVQAGGDDVDVLLNGPADGGTRFRYAADRFPGRGELEQKIREHTWTRSRPDAGHWEEHVTVVRRDNGTYDIRGWTSYFSA
jgi:hypothetical protein